LAVINVDCAGRAFAFTVRAVAGLAFGFVFNIAMLLLVDSEDELRHKLFDAGQR